MTVLRLTILGLALLACHPPVKSEDIGTIFHDRMPATLLLGKKFVYRVESTKFPGSMIPSECHGSVENGIRILEVGRPPAGSVLAPYRLVHKVPNQGEPYTDAAEITSYWEASSGKETRVFCRKLFFDKCKTQIKHMGTVDSGPVPQFTLHDPFIAVSFQGTTLARYFTGGEQGNWTPDPSKFSLREVENADFGRSWRLESRSGGGWLEYSDSPEYYLLNQSPGIPETKLQITELKDFGTGKYPSKGKWTNQKHESTFELLSVEELPDDWGADLFFEWPRGTEVFTPAEEKIEKIPFHAEEIAAIKLRLKDNCLAGAASAKQTSWFLWINILVALLIACFWFYRKKSGRTPQQQSSL